MNILIAILIGLVAGFAAVMTLPKGRRDPGGGIVPMMLGLTGSIGGSFLGRSLGYGPVENLSGELNQPGFIYGILGSIVGAAVLLIVYRLVTSKMSAD